MQSVTKGTIEEAYSRVKPVVERTALQYHAALSEKYNAEVYLKREDLQNVRSYKVRGAYNKIAQLSKEERARGVVCASAGNHAQGVAKSCKELGITGHIFMPMNTPKQKVDRVRAFGGSAVELHLTGDTFDASFAAAKARSESEGAVLVHPFDDPQVISGQGTVAVEVFEELPDVDVLVVPIGGGGLVSGCGVYAKSVRPEVAVYGVEPVGAPSMHASLAAGEVVTLESVEKFVDGVAVKTVGTESFKLACAVVDHVELVSEGKVCESMIRLYQDDGIVAEPAGALSVAALDQLAEKLTGKKVVCIISGGNNDVSRYPEILERMLVHQGLKHYFIVEFSQRPGALRMFLSDILGPDDDITLFEYVKKNNRETGPALVGIELSRAEDYAPLCERIQESGIGFETVTPESPLHRFVV